MFKTYFKIPTLFLLSLILGFFIQLFSVSFFQVFALFPRNIQHIPGIFGMVFLHSNLMHLLSNLLPLTICLYGIYFFYNPIATKILLTNWLITGLFIWLLARPSFHIGASGLVYALIFFILISGLIRRNKQLLVFAFINLTLQSGLIWGMVPQDNQISWESHLIGGIVGSALAILFRKEGPQRDQNHFSKDEETDDGEDEYEQVVQKL